MLKRIVITVTVLAVVLVVASIVLFIMAIWVPDDRLGGTGFILLFAGFAAGIAAPLISAEF